MESRSTYKKFARFYDAYVQDFTRDIPLYLNYCNENLNLLEVGCGTGRVLRPILESGFNITGIDISDEMLEIAERKLSKHLEKNNLKLINHNFASSPLERTYDRVFVPFYTMNYLLEDNQQVTFLKNLIKSMKSGAILLADLFYPRPLSKPETQDSWQDGKSFLSEGRIVRLKDKRKFEDKIEERIQVFENDDLRDEVLTRRRYLTKKEANDLFSNTGFVNIKFTDGYDIDCFHQLEENEDTMSSFVVLAEKP